MDYIPVRVECHSVWKADEYPVCFYLGKEKFEIKEIIDRWYQGDINPEWPAANYFKVRTILGKLYVLKHEIIKDVWHLIVTDAEFFFDHRLDQ
ncbi:MAG: cytoplasmic protein [Bacteroidota bacterium]|nr:cytoplasmic protein [Bacteroidota bacterium]